MHSGYIWWLYIYIHVCMEVFMCLSFYSGIFFFIVRVWRNILGFLISGSFYCLWIFFFSSWSILYFKNIVYLKILSIWSAYFYICTFFFSFPRYFCLNKMALLFCFLGRFLSVGKLIDIQKWKSLRKQVSYCESLRFFHLDQSGFRWWIQATSCCCSDGCWIS